MLPKRLSLTSLKNNLTTLIAFSIVCYFFYHLVQGERGLLSWRRLQQKVEVLEAELTQLQLEKSTLERQVSLLSPSTLCLDMLEERVRNVLNFSRSTEDVIILDTE
jgi:cell division protein FtsB